MAGVAQDSCCPASLLKRRKASAFCCKMGVIQVKLWGKVRPKPHMMVLCALCALHQVWSLSHTTVRKVPSPGEIERPKKYHLLLAEDQTVRTYGKVAQLQQRVCHAAGFLHCNQPRRLHLTCGLFKKYSPHCFPCFISLRSRVKQASQPIVFTTW